MMTLLALTLLGALLGYIGGRLADRCDKLESRLTILENRFNNMDLDI